MGIRSIRSALRGAALALAAWAASAPAQPVTTLPPPGSPDWEPVVFPSIPRHTRYSVVQALSDAEPRPAFLSESDCAASGMLLPLRGVNVERTPVLQWSWKVIRGLDIANEREKAGDDFAARVYVLFRFDPSTASLRERLIHAISTRLADREVPGSVLNYVWSSRAAPGQSWQNPHEARAHVLTLRSGSFRVEPGTAPGEGWRHERVDLLADHRRRIGGSGRAELLALAIMSDSDNTCQQSSAFFSGFRLSAAGPSPGEGASLHPGADAGVAGEPNESQP